MPYQPKNFNHLLGLNGFSDNLLKNHFALYEGYVTNTNKLNESLTKSVMEEKIGTVEYAELKRRFGWEFNGMRLHEYYFDNMRKENTKLGLDSNLAKKIAEDFGSYGNWEKDFKGVSGLRGIGWSALYYDKETERLFNAWIDEHNIGHLATAKLLLIMDVFEHAFMLDYGLKRANYINAFFKIIDWKVVEARAVFMKSS